MDKQGIFCGLVGFLTFGLAAFADAAAGTWVFTPSGSSKVAGTLSDGNWTFTLTAKDAGSRIDAVSAGSGDLDLSAVYDHTEAADPGYGIKIVGFKNDVPLRNFSLTSFTSGPYVKSIGNGVFKNCSLLRTVRLNEGLTSIGYQAFCFRSGTGLDTQTPTCLESVSLPSTLTTISGEAFKGTTNLTTITPFLPASVTTFGGDNTFYACAVTGRLSLTSTNLTDLKSQAFYGCGKITEVDLSGSIQSMNSTFASCGGLTNLVSGLPSALRSTYKAFASCSKLSGEIDMSGCTNLLAVSDETFNGASSITSVILPPRVTNLAYRAFRNCAKLRTVKASDPGLFRKSMIAADGIIAKHAFNGASKLESVQVPWGGKTSFGTELPFGSCSSLTNVWFFGKAPDADCMDFFTSGPAAYKCTLDVSKRADMAGWQALGRALTEEEKEKAEKPAGAVFAVLEKPAGKEAWLRWKPSPLYTTGVVVIFR